jgi:hypothetical protein
MAIFSFSSVLSLAACIAASSAQDVAHPDKAPVTPPFDMQVAVSTHIGQHLQGRKFDISYWDEGWIPGDCAIRSAPEGYSAADFEAFNVTYTDCDEPWVMCRHKRSTTSAQTMAEVR